MSWKYLSVWMYDSNVCRHYFIVFRQSFCRKIFRYHSWLYCILMRFSVLFWINCTEAVMQYALDSYMLSNKVHTQFSISSCKTLKDWIPISVTVILWEYCIEENRLLLSINFLLPNGSFKNDGASLRYWTVMVTSSPAFRSRCTCQCDK